MSIQLTQGETSAADAPTNTHAEGEAPATTSGRDMSAYMTPILIAAAVVIGVAGQFLLKAGMDMVGRVDSFGAMLSGPVLLRMVTTWQVPFAIVLYALGAFLWMIVLSRENVSWAYPFMGLTYVLVMIGGALLFKERIVPMQVFGTLLVSVGVLLIARS